MCIDFFIAAAVPIPDIPWRDGFISTSIITAEHPVNAKFTLPFRKNLSSHFGCGCGFIYPEWDEEMVIPAAQVQPDYGGGEGIYIDFGSGIVVEPLEDEPCPSHVQLAELIRNLLRDGEHVEMFGCWEGQWSDPILKEVRITPDDLMKRDFFFYHRNFYRVKAS